MQKMIISADTPPVGMQRKRDCEKEFSTLSGISVPHSLLVRLRDHHERKSGKTVRGIYSKTLFIDMTEQPHT